jgi:hypothetical protein
MDEQNIYIEKQLSDHENRLRRLEESDVAQRIELSAIGKSQAEIKLMMAEQSKENMKQSEKQQDMLNGFTSQMLDYFKEKERRELEQKAKEKTEELKEKKANNKINNQIKFYKTKQFWTLLGTLATGILGGILTYFGLK